MHVHSYEDWLMLCLKVQEHKFPSGMLRPCPRAGKLIPPLPSEREVQWKKKNFTSRLEHKRIEPMDTENGQEGKFLS